MGFINNAADWFRSIRNPPYISPRNYDAGQNDRLNDGWRVMNQSGDVTDRVSRDTVRARARDLERNSDIMGGFIMAFERNVVGDGIKLQARTDDKDRNKQLEALFKEWCKARNCDVTGMQTFNELLRMAVRRKKVDGGILIIKRYLKDRKIPFCLQVLEVDELDDVTRKPKNEGHTVVNGIEYNAFRAPVGYWIRQYTAEGYQTLDPVYIDAKDVIFYHERTRPSQLREISGMASTLTRIRDINSYLEAVSIKERIAACLSVFIRKVGNTIGRTGRSNQTLQDKSSGYDGKRLSPGFIMGLAPGEDVQVVTPPNQSGSAADFVRLQQRIAGAGQGLSYEVSSRDMSQVNYSSARQGLIEDMATYEIEQQMLMDHVMSEVYETFVTSVVLAGLIDLPDFWENKQAYLRHEWITPAKPWIDPLKEARATLIALNTKQKTFAQICGENGLDWREVLEQCAEEKAYAQSLGLTIGGNISVKYNDDAGKN